MSDDRDDPLAGVAAALERLEAASHDSAREQQRETLEVPRWWRVEIRRFNGGRDPWAWATALWPTCYPN